MSRTRAGVLRGERLHLGRRSQRACGSSCGRWAGPTRRWSPRSGRRRRSVATACSATRSETSTRQVNPAARSVARSASPCRTTPRTRRAAVLGHVEPERDEPVLVGARRRGDARRAAARRRCAGGRVAGQRRVGDGRWPPSRSPERRQACSGQRGPAPNTQPEATSWESGEAAAATAWPLRVEQRDVPVTAAAGEPDLHLTGARHDHRARDDARRARPQRLMARARWQSRSRRARVSSTLAGVAAARPPGARERAASRRGEAEGVETRQGLQIEWAIDLPLPPASRPVHAVNRESAGAAK